MKLVIASDIHGAAEWCERLMAQVEELNPDRVVLLGDLAFPCMADHNVLVDSAANNKTLFFTHGHVYGPGLHNSIDKWPALPANSALVYGHTHKKVLEEAEDHPGITVFNPGSVGIPKDGTHSFGIYEDGAFAHRILGE